MARLVGVLGGTFDPPHLGHQILAEEARISLNLEKVLWVLTPNPPHKPDQPISDLGVRIEMVGETVRHNPSFELSPLDIERPPPHYAVDTMRALTIHHSDTKFIYLMGGDSLAELPTWHDASSFTGYCNAIAVLSRSGVSINFEELEKSLPGLQTKLFMLESPSIDVSSQEIRERVRDQIAYAYLVPYGVAPIIEKYHLYR